MSRARSLPPTTREADCDFALSGLTLLQHLAHDNAVSFDRVRARMLLGEQFSDVPQEAPQRLQRMQRVLSALGIQGRLRELTLADAFDACRAGVRLAAALPGGEHAGAWVLLHSAGLRKARLACEQGADVWATRDQLQQALQLREAEAPIQWLVTEPALPCAPVTAQPAPGHQPTVEHHDETHPTPWRRLVAILRPELSDIWVVGVFSAVVSLLALATPITVEALVNTVAFGSLLQPVVVLSLVLLGFLGFAAAIRVLQTYISEIIQRRLFVRVVADLSQRLTRVRQDAYEDAHGPELLNRFFDVMTVQKSAALLVLDGIAIVLQAIVGMAVLAFYHPLLLGFDLALMAALGFVVLVLGRGGVATSIAESRAKYAVAAWLEQLALCPVTFKNAGGGLCASEHADKLAIEYLLARQQHFAVLLRQIAFTLALQALAGSVLLGVGGWLVIQGQLTLGQLVAAELIVTLLVGSFTKLGKHLEAYYDLLAAVEKLGHLFDLPVEEQRGEALPPASRGLAVQLGPHEIAAGELVAVVGSTAAERSHLLAGAFGLERDSGTRLNGVPVGALEVSSLRSQVALVRHCEIFAASLAENVQLGRTHATRAAARACLEQLGLREHLAALPDGLETILQPSGVPLTEGLARCVVLARALLGEPRLLLIDGLLDGLPDELLPEVLAALARNVQNSTVVIATGRRDIARLCQRIVALPRASAASLLPSSTHS